ncbi:FBP C-terminal treble-clef zinc-finger [Geodermatophilus saharensis]|uniref:FBP C-terminal treble-clef zinc-finger n=1 Tax=Geodermatophilus saharensis TaxID=1137994 RepID=A0A239E5E4_9ACTN|nr:FBP domain-containing protein [Geodermatophilus saharensis]SNS39847.1 FBP C-terminal treble-clef zinc-finger [Geodermatophilus saharensis]
MDPLTEPQIRRSFVNCSRSEAAAATLPAGLSDLPWDDLDFLGWRDARAPLRGYAVLWREGRPLGIALRAADTAMSARTSAMCLLCQTTQTGADVSLFTARRAGEAGRNGNTVGQYVCADLACSSRVRTEIPPWLRERDPAEVVPERVDELRRRLDTFVGHVLRP